MNINELDSYNLDDAVKFNQKLNPRIWGADEKMLPQVRDQLLRIADDFREFLGIDIEVKDITVSGSNAAYTYTPHSDIDLHLVVDLPEADANEVYRELFDAKKYAYNEQHNIKIGGYDVELYVQDANKTHHSQGIYSIKNNDWVSVPKRRRIDVDDISVQSKFEDLGHRIELAVASGDYEKMSELSSKIREYRQAGLDAHGEFGPENLAFKILRTQGLIKKLYDARNAAKDELLSLDERKKKRKKKKSVRYGFGGYWYPGTAYAGQDHPAGAEGGGDGGGGESLRESAQMSDEDTLRDFVNYCAEQLDLKRMPTVKLRRDPQWSVVNRTFGRYQSDANTLEVAFGQRHIMDVLRTVAHELTHQCQHEREDVPGDAGETGSPYENEANARAGVLMRDYGQLHPELFDTNDATLGEGASGYIPTRAQAKDPRFAMALTVDIKPGQVGKEANKLKLKTDRQGQPQVARANGLFETLMAEYKGLNELALKSTLPVTQTMNHPGKQVYDMKTQSGEYQIVFSISNKDDNFDNDPDYDGPTGYILDVLLLGQDPNGSWTQYNTNVGEKQVAQIFATIAQLAVKIIKTQPGINEIEIKGADPQRSRIYSRLMQQNIDSLLPGWKLGGAGLVREKPQQAVAESVLNETQTVTRIDSKPITDFGSNLKSYKHTDDWSQSGIDTGDDSYWQKRNIKPKVSKGLYAGEPHRTALYATGNAHETRYVEFTQNGQPIVYFDRKDLPKMRARKTYLTVFDAANFKKLPTGEYFSDNPGQPIKQTEIGDPFQYIASQGWIVRVTDNLDKVFKQVQAMHKTGKIAQYGAEGMNESVEDLDEVKMSPGALEKFASSKEAQGIRAGFEAELIFRDTQGDDEDDYDMEPDYDMDERAYSVQQVIEFFQNDDYGYGLSDRQTRSLENELDETYMNWRDEQMTEDFKNEAEDLVREIWLEERPMNERILSALSDGMGLDDAEADKILIIGDKAPRFTKSSEQMAYKEANPGYDKYLEAVDIADAILDEEVEASIDRQDGYYDQALDNFRDNYSGDDDSFFSDVGMRWMSDVANNFGLDWPYMTGGGNSNNGSRSWDDIGAELQQVVGMPVKVSSNYHSTPRKEGQWIIEPDGSLDPDDKSEEAGLEIVSPPMPLLMTLEKLKAVTDWANNPSEGNAYTNSSTGLHMGVSIPFVGGDVDYVKLIMFMGDKYVLEQFGRASNTYTASAMDKLRQNLAGGRSDPAGVATLLKSNLAELAFKELQKGVGTSKYTSAHIQNGYIEFRSPGGDWLAKSDEDIGILENTMMRFAQAMYIASRADLERNEYAKKLYKLISEYSGDSDHLKMFAEFNAGMINKEQLKKQWAEKTIGTEKKMNQRWKLYQNVSGRWEPVPAAEWNGYSEDRVKNAIWSKYGREALESGEYKLVNMSEDQQWEVYDVKTGKTLEIVKGRNKGEVADAVYDKYIDQGIGFNVRAYVDPATLTPRAKLAKRIVEPKKQPTPSEQQAKNERGVPYWEIYEKETGHVVHTFLSDDLPDAVTDAYNWLTGIGAEQPDLFSVRAKMVPNPQATDNRRDSADLQRNLGVQDIDTDVAQNFTQPADATDRVGSWVIYDVTLGREISRMNDVPWQQANDRADELERSTGHNMSVRGLSENGTNESIDPVSGAGAVPPRPTVKKINKDKFDPVEPVAKTQSYRSAIGQAISKKDLEDMTQQIKIARKLGDSVMEMEDTPPEVIRALNQAAQKNGYKNWADVKANPRSSSAVVTVAKLADTILKTTGPQHNKIFYKNKLDK
jgi:hypothetical protein